MPRGAKPVGGKDPQDHHPLEEMGEVEVEMVETHNLHQDPHNLHQEVTAMGAGLEILEVTPLEVGMELMVQEPEEVMRLPTLLTGTGNLSRQNYMKSRN